MRLEMLRSLQDRAVVDEIIFSSDAQAYIDVAAATAPAAYLHRRAVYYASRDCTTSEYFEHIATSIVQNRGSHILYSQVTHPMITSADLEDVVKTFCSQDLAKPQTTPYC